MAMTTRVWLAFDRLTSTNCEHSAKTDDRRWSASLINAMHSSMAAGNIGNLSRAPDSAPPRYDDICRSQF